MAKRWLLGALLMACSEDSMTVAMLDGAMADAATLDAAFGGSDAAIAPDEGGSDASAPPVDRATFCAGAGSAAVLPGGGSRCLGATAEEAFAYAICACESIETVGEDVRTDSFDSERDEVVRDSGAPIGTNGSLSVTGGIDVGGSLVVGSAAPLEFTGTSPRIGGDLASGGPVRFQGRLRVERDVRVASVGGVGTLEVGRDLYTASGRADATRSDVGGRTVAAAVSVAPPCACGDTLDIRGAVDAARFANDNDEVGLEADDFEGIVGTEERTLPCGRFFLTGLSGTGQLTLVVEGRTALYIDGDFTLQGGLQLELAEGAEIDVFLTGDLSSTGRIEFGDRSAPAKARIYVGGRGEIDITGNGAFVGNLYAPSATIRSTGGTEVFGALLGQNIEARGSLVVHYDRAITRTGEECPDTPCERCGDCGGGVQCDEANMCLPGCTEDAECCGSLVCTGGGECIPLLI
ncbi:MAG: hypothetical protein AAF938_01630 [Myxococcota bacterium]